MSLSESAATAVLSVAAVASDTPGEGNQPRWADQTKGQRDLYTQLVISVAVGLSAFMAFCVSFMTIDRPVRQSSSNHMPSQ